MAVYKKILLATDLSPKAARAREAAMQLARDHGAELHLLHVNVLSALHMDYRGLKEADDYVASVMTTCRESLDAVPDEPGLTIERAVRTDESPATAVLAYAEEHAADLIVMGTDRVDTLQRFFVGSVVLKVLHNAGVPVLVVGRDSAGATPARRILVATDLSEAADGAVHHAARLAAMNGAALTLLHVMEPQMATPYDMGQVIGDPDPEQGRAALAGFLERTPLEVTPDTDVRVGPAIRTIVDAAETGGADLIVLGATGHSALGRVLLGSTADRVVQHAPCPVLVHRHKG